MVKHIKLTIDGKPTDVLEGTTIMKAAYQLGIEIPHLCYLEGINEISACKICVVEMEGKERLITACNNKVEEGMVLYTNSPKVRKVRKTNVQLILSQHDCHCATCVRSGNCPLQTIANDLGILEIPFREEITRTPWNPQFPLIRDSAKCIKCMRCVQICNKVQGMHIWDVQNTGSRTTVDVSDNRTIEGSDCVICGQCITHCPTGALRERDDTEQVYAALASDQKVTVVQVAPAVRTAWGEAMGLMGDEASEGRMVAALKRIGFDYVFDTNFAADLTIMEEGNELLKRLSDSEKYQWPMFTSCCPAWISFIKSKYPAFIEQLSTAKSPQQMFGAVTKTYFAQKMGLKPQDIYCVSIMPCVAKKKEAAALDMDSTGTGQDVDTVLTTREFARMIREEHINVKLLPEEGFDSPLGESTGAGVLFGTAGGVMEAALRTAYAVVEGSNPPAEAFRKVRTEETGNGYGTRREAEFMLGSRKLRVCTVSGLEKIRELMEEIQDGTTAFDFVEMMSCPGGCVGGGGQPIKEGCEQAFKRGQELYRLDKKRTLRFSHENEAVKRLYDEYLGEALGEISHRILHVEY